MRMRLFPIFVILLLMTPISALAQDAVAINTIEVELWPEYDQPTMLVIYRIVLSPQVSLPKEINFRIPASAGDPNAVAVRDMDGSLFNAPYDRQVDGDWSVITFTATFPEIQIEYYDPQLVKGGAQRHFEYTWPGDYSVDSLVVIVQQPLSASQLTTDPQASQVTQGPGGMAYSTVNLGAIQAGEVTRVTIDYTKNDDTLSVEGLQIQPSAPINVDTSGRVSIVDVLPWGLGILGVLLLVGGVWWYWQTGREQPQPNKRRRRSRTPQKRKTNEVEDNYCHQCGKRAGSTDAFCRSCGSKLRLP